MPAPSDIAKPLGEAVMTPEEHLFERGGRRPDGFGLHSATTSGGMETRAAIDYLLAQVRKQGTFASAAKGILRSLRNPGEIPLSWHDLCALDRNYWPQARRLIDFVQQTGGLIEADFADGGAEFDRLVFGPTRQGTAGPQA